MPCIFVFHARVRGGSLKPGLARAPCAIGYGIRAEHCSTMHAWTLLAPVSVSPVYTHGHVHKSCMPSIAKCLLSTCRPDTTAATTWPSLQEIRLHCTLMQLGTACGLWAQGAHPCPFSAAASTGQPVPHMMWLPNTLPFSPHIKFSYSNLAQHACSGGAQKPRRMLRQLHQRCRALW